MSKVIAVVLAGGASERFAEDAPKQLVRIAGKPVMQHTLDVFERHPGVDEIFLVIRSDLRGIAEGLLLKGGYRKVKRVLNGGRSRQESSAIGVAAVEGVDAIVVLHDAARPLVSSETVSACIEAVRRYGAVDVAIETSDTIIKVTPDGMIDLIPDRRLLRRGQTPQAFRAGVIKEAHKRAEAEGFCGATDDCGLVIRYRLSAVAVVPGTEENMKLTHGSDLFLAEKLFQLRTVHESTLGDVPDLTRRCVVVFGGSEGIGDAVCRKARECGAWVVSSSRRTGVDVRHIEAVRTALEEAEAEHGEISAIVNAAGVLGFGPLVMRPAGEVKDEMEVNLLGAINVAQAGIPFLARSAGALVLFTSSSYTRGRAFYSVYSATKAAIVNLVQALADEVADLGVRVNAVNPQRTATRMRLGAFGVEDPETLLTPDRVAWAVLRTIGSTMTGQVIDVRLRGFAEK